MFYLFKHKNIFLCLNKLLLFQLRKNREKRIWRYKKKFLVNGYLLELKDYDGKIFYFGEAEHYNLLFAGDFFYIVAFPVSSLPIIFVLKMDYLRGKITYLRCFCNKHLAEKIYSASSNFF
jgi:hypothetical protein